MRSWIAAALVALAAVGAASGCSDDKGGRTPSIDGATSDTGTRLDAAEGRDVSPDASVDLRDTGAMGSDAEPDGGTATDGALGTDARPDPDATTAMDATTHMDGGAPMDASTSDDGGDAGTGSPMDSATISDAASADGNADATADAATADGSADAALDAASADGSADTTVDAASDGSADATGDAGSMDAGSRSGAIALVVPGTSGMYSGIVDLVAVGDRVVALSNPRYAGTIYATLTRFLPDGTVDTTFGTNGFAVLNPGGNRNAVASELAVDGQGRLVVGAYFVSATGTTTYLGAVRTSADGVPDQGFGTGGFFLHSFGPLSSTGGALGIASDNDVLVGGVYGPGGSVGPKQWALLRIDASGSFDGSFGSGGTLLIDVRQAGSGSGEVGDLVGLSNGSFLAGGWFVNRAVDTTHSGLLARFGATGAPDGTFGTAGRVDLVNFVGSRQSTGLQTSGRAVIMISSIALERYDTAGVRDATWGSSGVAQLTTAVATIHVGADNRLYAAGQALGAPTRIQLVRRNEDGTPDTGFGTRTLGLEAAGLTGSVTAEAICLTSDGRAYVGGSFTATGGQQGLFLAPFTL